MPRGGRRALAVHAVVAVMAWRGGPHAIAHTPQGVSTLAHYNHQHRARHTVHAHIVAKLGVAHHTHREQPPHARGVCGCGGKAAGCGVCRSQVCCDVAVIVCVGCSMGGGVRTAQQEPTTARGRALACGVHGPSPLHTAQPHPRTHPLLHRNHPVRVHLRHAKSLVSGVLHISTVTSMLWWGVCVLSLV